MSNKIIINPGDKFTKLTIVSFYGSVKGHKMYNCLCDCGEARIIRGSALMSSNTLSCGCYNNELAAQLSKKYIQTHGETVNRKRSTEYESYNHMKSRCYRKTDPKYKNYGARGIIVCDRWLGPDGFHNFLSDMGRKPSPMHTIEREENDGIYEHHNCVWALPEIQAANKTTTVRLESNGVKTYQAALARQLGVTPHAIEYHLDRGKSASDIIDHFKNK